jgi:hypothetical protein
VKPTVDNLDDYGGGFGPARAGNVQRSPVVQDVAFVPNNRTHVNVRRGCDQCIFETGKGMSHYCATHPCHTGVWMKVEDAVVFVMEA